MRNPTKAEVAASDRLLTHLSHSYEIPYKDALGKSRVFKFTPHRERAKCTELNWPADEPTQEDLMDRFVIATYRDPRDCHMVKAWLSDSSAFEVGLTEEELDYATNTPHRTLVSHAIGDKRFEEWYLEDREEEQRELANDEQRQMLSQLRGCERFVPAMSRNGGAAVVQQLRHVLATARGPDGILCVDMAAAHQVLGAFVGLKMEQGFSR